jgi:hypothetical protein
MPRIVLHFYPLDFAGGHQNALESEVRWSGFSILVPQPAPAQALRAVVFRPVRQETSERHEQPHQGQGQDSRALKMEFQTIAAPTRLVQNLQYPFLWQFNTLM